MSRAQKMRSLMGSVVESTDSGVLRRPSEPARLIRNYPSGLHSGFDCRSIIRCVTLREWNTSPCGSCALWMSINLGG
jgi:hypothetical protein